MLVPETTIENTRQYLINLEEMGYTDYNLNEMALSNSNGNLNLAIDWIEQFR